MNIRGRFGKASNTTYSDGVVLIGFVGNVCPHDLTLNNINWLKQMYNMPKDCKHEILTSWPEDIEPVNEAAKKNFKNGFLLLKVA